MTNKRQAIQYLTQRYNEQCEKYPRTRDAVSLDLYITRNTRAAIANMKERAKA